MRKVITAELLHVLYQLVEDIEVELFDMKDDDYAIYGEHVYKKSDFKRCKDAILQIEKTYKKGGRKSYKYIQKNKEYNNLLNRIRYYKGKPNKTEKDYQQLEEIYKDLEILKRDRQAYRDKMKEMKEKHEAALVEIANKKIEEGSDYDVKF